MTNCPPNGTCELVQRRKSPDFEESGIPQAASLQVTWDVLGLSLTFAKQGWGEA